MDGIRGLMILMLAAAIGVWSVAAAHASDDDKTITAEELALLKAGGVVLVLRHANSPQNQSTSFKMSPDCDLAPGRGLDALGFYQAWRIGEFLEDEGVRVIKAYTSKYCRAWDTALLAAGDAPVVFHASQLISEKAVASGPDKEAAQQAVAAFKAQVAKKLSDNPGGVVILSSHSDVAPVYGAQAGSSGKVKSGVVHVVEPEDWRQLFRIDFSEVETQ